jgi:hypothetical protein
MVEIKYTGDALWARIERAVENVKHRMRRTTDALNAAGVPYAVVGGNAVQYWVAQVDESVVRNTRDVDIILNRADLPRAIQALESAGFTYRHSASVTESLFQDRRGLAHFAESARQRVPVPFSADGLETGSMFLDGPNAKARDAVHVVFAGEKVRDDYPEPVPAIDDYELMHSARTLPLEPLVRMKLTSFRRQDQVHLQDMISVGLIDQSWLDRLSPELRARLQELLDDPDG